MNATAAIAIAIVIVIVIVGFGIPSPMIEPARRSPDPWKTSPRRLSAGLAADPDRAQHRADRRYDLDGREVALTWARHSSYNR